MNRWATSRNSLAKLTPTAKAVLPKAGVATDGNLKIKIGRQIEGAAVDLVEAGADADKGL